MTNEEMNRKAGELMGWETVELISGEGIDYAAPGTILYLPDIPYSPLLMCGEAEHSGTIYEIFSPATNRNHAGLLLAEVERLGKKAEFVTALWDLIIKEPITTARLLRERDWLFVTATPEQITRAFIACMEK